MGTKFANFHLKTTDQNNVNDVLQKLSEAAGAVLSYTVSSAGPDIISQYLYTPGQPSPRQNPPSVSFYVHGGERWSSVLNDHLEWGAVEEVGEIASNFADQPVMTIGFFDEDVLESERADAEYTAQTLETDLESVENWFAIDNPEAAIDELSRLTGMHFWVHSAWIEDDPEIEQVYAKRVYKLQQQEP